MKRWQTIVIAVALILAIAVVAGYRMGVRLLQDKVVDALGPGSRLTELKVNWFSIELLGLSINAPKGWPAARTFEAERVTIIPDLRTLFTDKIRISSIVIEKPYLSVLRNPGKLIMVPSLTEREKNQRNDGVSVTTFGTPICHNMRNSRSASMRCEEQNPLRTHFFERCTMTCREGDLEIRDNDSRCIVKTKRSERCDT